jgi:hypothetical protein
LNEQLGTGFKECVVEGPSIGFLFNLIDKEEVVWILSVNEVKLDEKSNIAENTMYDIN